jgi:hypothetical protein
VDAYQEMLDQIPDTTRIKPICLDAMAFAKKPFAFTKVLIKETIHHVEDKDQLFAYLRRRMPPGGRILLVHVPPELDYPIFDKALERAKHWHADPDVLESQLRNAGFRVDRDAIDYPHHIRREHYFAQVRSRFMSVLHHFSDLEMEEGLREMEEKYGDQDVLEFIDHFDFITGIKE